MTPVVVLVPGLMGSQLQYQGDVIWPGPVRQLWLPYGKMAELLQEDLVATDVIRDVLISSQYSTLIEDLNTCGFREDDDPPTLIVFPYDWRKDNAQAAGKLADLLDGTVAAHNGTADIFLVAHSMGGLISRYYLESGDYAARPGLKAVRQLITLGTPHRGSPIALSAARGEEKQLWLNADQVLKIVSDPRYPSVYQLLPPKGEPFAWNRDGLAQYDPVDIYDPAVAKGLGLVPANLQAATAFHAKLDHTKRPAHVRYFAFVGTRQTMVSHVLLRKDGAIYHMDKVEPEDAGDGTVPAWSATLTGLQGRPVGGEHGTIYKNDDLRRTLAGLLGKQGVLAAAAAPVEIAIRERVCHPGDGIHVALTFPSGSESLDGELRVERALFDARQQLTGFAAPASHIIKYAGLTAEKLGLTLDAPALPGVYRLAFYHAGEQHLAGSDELFVQGNA